MHSFVTPDTPSADLDHVADLYAAVLAKVGTGEPFFAEQHALNVAIACLPGPWLIHEVWQHVSRCYGLRLIAIEREREQARALLARDAAERQAWADRRAEDARGARGGERDAA